ncbi:hypothetical protein [Luteolibacter soli]|uniref:HEAT repeat domain-containing protein n=1 Tax=Luteolibacter soli TaxID=3135280 RepID=A0ABU9ATD9_9BACT
MRVPLYLSVAAIAIALGIGWHDHHRLIAARAELDALVREGDAHAAGDSSGGSQDSRRTREEARKAGAELASDWMDYLTKLESPEREDGAVLKERDEELFRRTLLMTTTGWDSFITRLLEAEDVPEHIRRSVIFRTLDTWIPKDPRGALKLIGKARGLIGDDPRGASSLSTAIHYLARTDPAAAVERVRHPEENLAGCVNDRTRTSLIAGVAFSDPALALQLVDEMDLKDRHSTIFSMGETPRTGPQKTAVLAAMRERLPALANDGARAEISQTILSGLANSFTYGNFSEARQWLESAKLTPTELAIFARQVQGSVLRPETGLWIEWLGSRLSPDDSRRIAATMMNDWADHDYQAATDWLSNKAPDGPVKSAAITGYIGYIADYQHETAARWAITLPEGDERDNSLRQVYRRWPAQEADARDAFAKENGFTWP